MTHTKLISVLILSITLAAGLLLNTALSANIAPPIQVLNEASQQMLAELKTHRQSIRRGNTQVIHDIVSRILIPHIALDSMARAVVGRHYWLSATTQQRQQFIGEFVRLVTETYATALSSYEDQKVLFLPLRGSMKNKKIVQVDSRIVHNNGATIPVSYQMILLGSEWKVKDFNVDGVVLTQSYRSQFAKVLAQGGMPALIQELAKHNSAR